MFKAKRNYQTKIECLADFGVPVLHQRMRVKKRASADAV